MFCAVWLFHNSLERPLYLGKIYFYMNIQFVIMKFYKSYKSHTLLIPYKTFTKEDMEDAQVLCEEVISSNLKSKTS